MLRNGAESVAGSLAAAVEVLEDTFEEDVRIPGESQDCLQRCGAFLDQQGLQVGSGGEAPRMQREDAAQEEKEDVGVGHREQ